MPSLSSTRSAAARARLTGRTHTALPRLRVPVSAYVVDCAVYVDGRRLPGRWTHDDAVAEVRGRGEGFVWIGLHEPTDEQITGIADIFGLHELAVEDAVHAHQRPKLERFDDTLFMVLKTVRYVGHAEPRTATEIVETGEVMVFLGRDFVVTVRHGQHCALRDVRRKLEADPEQLALGPAAVLHAIADHVVDSYLEVTEAIEDDIDEMEGEVFNPRSAMDAEQIYVMKREVLELRRAVTPLVAPVRKLAEGYSALVPHEVRSYFRNVDDHLSTVAERVAGFDELLTTLVDAILTKHTMQSNKDMRKITAYAALISVPTMIAGIYGMNFDVMPETKWPFGYPAVLIVIALICVVLYRNFRKNQWL
ncbi:magnesium and cobalt transport protein CorA [Pseudonocardia asaccharolytica]|uniref:Magnesium transport protein CorA n=1 Tax=Pseudonocardia asaccharolytica DSM 44247 = NBRC 16224 TaxID=1123024 RepID=A0A511D5B1_9PSEU|nr:magnesium transport protein CorA [Pseudonocardia asaccharolytica DSM 44247 = NBRC 16224]